MVAQPRALLPRLPFPGHRSHQICRLCARGRACLATPGQAISVTRERVKHPPRVQCPQAGPSLLPPPTPCLLRDPGRAPFPWEQREGEGSGWSRGPAGPRGHLPTMYPRPVCLSPVPSSHGAPPDGGGLTSGLTSCRLLPEDRGCRAVLGPRLQGGVSESSPEANPRVFRKEETWWARGGPGCAPVVTLRRSQRV